MPGLEGHGGAPSRRAGRSPAANLLIGASAAIVLLTPLAPVLVRAALLATMQSLLREAAPRVRQVVQRMGMHPTNGGATKHDASMERRGHPT